MAALKVKRVYHISRFGVKTLAEKIYHPSFSLENDKENRKIKVVNYFDTHVAFSIVFEAKETVKNALVRLSETKNGVQYHMYCENIGIVEQSETEYVYTMKEIEISHSLSALNDQVLTLEILYNTELIFTAEWKVKYKKLSNVVKSKFTQIETNPSLLRARSLRKLSKYEDTESIVDDFDTLSINSSTSYVESEEIEQRVQSVNFYRQVGFWLYSSGNKISFIKGMKAQKKFFTPSTIYLLGVEYKFPLKRATAVNSADQVSAEVLFAEQDSQLSGITPISNLIVHSRKIPEESFFTYRHVARIPFDDKNGIVLESLFPFLQKDWQVERTDKSLICSLAHNGERHTLSVSIVQVSIATNIESLVYFLLQTKVQESDYNSYEKSKTLGYLHSVVTQLQSVCQLYNLPNPVIEFQELWNLDGLHDSSLSVPRHDINLIEIAMNPSRSPSGIMPFHSMLYIWNDEICEYLVGHFAISSTEFLMFSDYNHFLERTPYKRLKLDLLSLIDRKSGLGFDIYYGGSFISLVAKNECDFKKWIANLTFGCEYVGVDSQQLGRKVSITEDISRNRQVLEDFMNDFRSVLWFTYRKDFKKIKPSNFNTDAGWGCMIRTGQCLLAVAFCRVLLGRHWRINQVQGKVEENNYSFIIGQFLDFESATYSVHNIATTAAKQGRPIGEWFSPCVLVNALQKINASDKKCPIAIFRVENCLVLAADVYRTFKEHRKPVLLLLPTRLGTTCFNRSYTDVLKAFFAFPQFAGISGGKPNKSLFFVGIQDNELLYLDPHTVRPVLKKLTVPCPEYHTSIVNSLPIHQLDPSMVIGFLVRDITDFEWLRALIGSVQTSTSTILDIQ